MNATATLDARAAATLADLDERRAALLAELAAFAPGRRGEMAFTDRLAALAGVERRIARLTRPR